MTGTWKKLLLLYPLTFSLAPVVSLLAENYGELPPYLSYRSMILIAAVTAFFIAILGLVLRDWYRGAAVVSVGALLFFSYGHLYAYLETTQILGSHLGRHRYLIPAFMAVFAGASWLIMRRVQDVRVLTSTLALVGLSFLVFPSVSLFWRIMKSGSFWSPAARAATYSAGLPGPAASEKLPDIYYIILDGYARSDVMRTRLGYNNTEFLDFLERRGFFVADQSYANHNWTALSLASSLNMQYVQELGLPLAMGTYPAIFADPIRHSRVRFELEQLGYQIVAIQSAYLPTEIIDADHYYHSVPPEEERDQRAPDLNSFEMLLVHSSAGLVVLDLLGPSLHEWVGFRTHFPNDVLRTVILDGFENLKASVELDSPKFVFAHIVTPHSPYLFDRKGEFLNPSGPTTFVENGNEVGEVSKQVLYRDQAIYATQRVEEVVAHILEHSDPPPVIVIQADHGPAFAPGWASPTGEGVWERLAILNAYHLPRGCDSRLYPEVTPVNTFRLILSCYFGRPYPLIEDKSYFSYWPRENPYEFIELDLAHSMVGD